MIFAILFIIAFLIGAIIYYFSDNWMIAVALPAIGFTINALLDQGAEGALLFTLVFGLTIVCFASLLGAYVVQIRRPEINERTESNSE